MVSKFEYEVLKLYITLRVISIIKYQLFFEKNESFLIDKALIGDDYMGDRGLLENEEKNIDSAIDTGLSTCGQEDDQKARAWRNWGVGVGVNALTSGLSIAGAAAGGAVGGVTKSLGSTISGCLSSLTSTAITAVGGYAINMGANAIRYAAGDMTAEELQYAAVYGGISAGIQVGSSAATGAIGGAINDSIGNRYVANVLNAITSWGINALANEGSFWAAEGIMKAIHPDRDLGQTAANRYNNAGFWINQGTTLASGIVSGIATAAYDNRFGNTEWGKNNYYGYNLYKNMMTEGISRGFGAIGGLINSGITGDWSYFGNSMVNLADIGSAYQSANMGVFTSGISQLSYQSASNYMAKLEQERKDAWARSQKFKDYAEFERIKEAEDRKAMEEFIKTGKSEYGLTEAEAIALWKKQESILNNPKDNQIFWRYSKKNINRDEKDKAEYEKLAKQAYDKNGNIKDYIAYKKFKQMHYQYAKNGIDLVDMTEWALRGIDDSIKNNKYGMGISETDGRYLTQILKGETQGGKMTEQERNQKFDEFKKSQLEKIDKMSIEDSEKKLLKEDMLTYLNGLRYIVDNRDIAPAVIARSSCRIVSDYLYCIEKGYIDPVNTSYEKYYQNKFEHGKIGYADSYTNAPMWNRATGYNDMGDDDITNDKIGFADNKNTAFKLYNSMNIEGRNISIKVSPDLQGLTTNGAKIKYSGINGLSDIDTRINYLIQDNLSKNEAINKLMQENGNLYLQDLPFMSTGLLINENSVKTLVNSLIMQNYADEIAKNNNNIDQYNDFKKEADKILNTYLPGLYNSIKNGNTNFIVQMVTPNIPSHYFTLRKLNDAYFRVYDHQGVYKFNSQYDVNIMDIYYFLSY